MPSGRDACSWPTMVVGGFCLCCRAKLDTPTVVDAHGRRVLPYVGTVAICTRCVRKALYRAAVLLHYRNGSGWVEEDERAELKERNGYVVGTRRRRRASRPCKLYGGLVRRKEKRARRRADAAKAASGP